MISSNDSPAAVAASLPTFVLGHDLARTESCDFSHPAGSLLANGYAFNADAVVLAAQNEGLGFDHYLARFLHAGFIKLGYKTPITALVEVDYDQVLIWLCSRKRCFDVRFLADFGPLEGYGRGVVGRDARPYGHWQQGQFHRVHPAGLAAEAVETFGGPCGHEKMPAELREDIVRRPTAYSWWSVPHLDGRMLVQAATSPAEIPQAYYLWTGEQS